MLYRESYDFKPNRIMRKNKNIPRWFLYHRGYYVFLQRVILHYCREDMLCLSLPKSALHLDSVDVLSLLLLP